jgi:hypothetical protein
MELGLQLLHQTELYRRSERRLNFSEHGCKLRTDERNRSDNHDGDESSDQTILNGGDAGFVFNET